MRANLAEQNGARAERAESRSAKHLEKETVTANDVANAVRFGIADVFRGNLSAKRGNTAFTGVRTLLSTVKTAAKLTGKTGADALRGCEMASTTDVPEVDTTSEELAAIEVAEADLAKRKALLMAG